MSLLWRKHFGINCPTCNSSYVVEIAGKQVELCLQDPVAGLRSLAPADQVAMADFYAEHQKLGHEPHPFVVELAPLPKG